MRTHTAYADLRTLSLAFALVTAALTGCKETTGEAKDDRTSVGIVLSSGGRGDQGFNDAVITGARRAAQELDVDTAVSENVVDEASSDALQQYARAGRDLVIGISFMVSEPAFRLAQKNPEVNFAVVDYSPVTDSLGRAMPPPRNLAGITFRAEEGAFLAGALAALKSSTRKVGFVGGMDAPVIRTFEAGYTAGVLEVCADCEVLVSYTGTSPAAFNDPVRGKQLALAQYSAGADVIFHASGATGRGVFAAAAEAGKWVIGVDLDQSSEAPGRVLTSVTKNLDVVVYDVIARQKKDAFAGGAQSFGLAEGGVGYVYNEKNAPLFPPSAHARIETLRQAIVAGLIKVPKVPRSTSRARR